MLTCSNCGFANPETAKFCSDCGKPLEQPRSVEGERRFATVLFADVARSTAIAERLDPEDWALIINGAFAFMNAAVSRYEGTVSRLMGDAVLALFGAPVAHEDDAERAVRAGLDIQESGMAYARTMKAKYGIDFDLRVGINTGTAVLAFVGDAIKSEYTALGDAANVAARLQSLAEPGTVLISADTERLVRPLFDFKPRGHMEMKGKTEPVECFEVTGAKARPGTTRGLQGLVSPMVGRDGEIELLRGRMRELVAGRGSVIAVVGEAGLGKSRLIAELRQERDALPEPRPVWLEARAISYGQSIPYFPWRQLGRQLIAADDVESAANTREKLAAFVERLQLHSKDIPFYETMLAVDGDESRAALASVRGDAVVHGVANSVVNAFKAAIHIGGPRPYVLVMDDLHWSDTATLELLAQVATLAAFEPLLILAVLRPDRKAPSWQLLDRLQASLATTFARIDLEPLGGAASSELLGNLLHIEDLPESIRKQILERAEGNPFYLEEVLRSLIDDGQVVRDGDHWRATRDIVDAKIPTTLEGVLASRIDRLPETTKRIAQTASVIGRIFQHRVLSTVCMNAPIDERVDNIEPHIATLSYEQLVREKTRDPEREYIFKHALTAEAAYNLLLKSRRRELHARAGVALETLFADRQNEFAPMLAHHFFEAEEYRRALRYSTVAAGDAKRLFAVHEELRHRDTILTLVDHIDDLPPRTVIDAILDWVNVRNRLAQYEGILAQLERAVSIAREMKDDRRLATALSWTANMHMVTGFSSRSVPYLIESAEIAQRSGDLQLLLLPLFFSAHTLLGHDPADGVAKFAEVIEIAQRYDVKDVLGHAMACRAMALARTGRFEEARKQIDEALEVEKTTTSPVKRADIHIGVGLALYDMGEIDKALEHTQFGAELSVRENALECAGWGYYGTGICKLELRRTADALTDLGRSLNFADQVGFDHMKHSINGNIAAAEFEMGQISAIDRLQTARLGAREAGDAYSASLLDLAVGRSLLKVGRLEEARAALVPAITYFREKSMRPHLATALDLSADILAAGGKHGEAEAMREEALQLKTVFHTTPDAQHQEGRGA